MWDRRGSNELCFPAVMKEDLLKLSFQICMRWIFHVSPGGQAGRQGALCSCKWLNEPFFSFFFFLCDCLKHIHTYAPLLRDTSRSPGLDRAVTSPTPPCPITPSCSTWNHSQLERVGRGQRSSVISAERWRSLALLYFCPRYCVITLKGNKCSSWLKCSGDRSKVVSHFMWRWIGCLVSYFLQT